MFYVTAMELYLLFAARLSYLEAAGVVTFKIPFEAERDAIWRVLVGNDPDRQTFSSRLAAIRFAMQRAASLARTSREARVVIEGADGHWRRFDATMTSID